MATQFIELEQGSPEWFEWRSNHKQASESPALLELAQVYPRTPLQLFEVKSGRVNSDDKTRFMEKYRHTGKTFEPIARDKISEQMGKDFKPVCVAGDDLYGASLDGFDGGVLLELKVPNKGALSDLWLQISNDTLPDHYMAQVQHQMLACEGSEVVFAAYDTNEDELVSTVVPRDELWIKRITDAWDIFWPLYKADVQPAPAKRDFVKLDDADMVALAKEYNRIKAKADEWGDKLDVVKKQVIACAGDRSIFVPGLLRLARFEQKGAVDYSKISALDDIDLDDYRKKPVVKRRIGEDNQS